MSGWDTHAMCRACWDAQNPGRVPCCLADRHETCCYCGAATDHGIYVRAQASEVKFCKCEADDV